MVFQKSYRLPKIFILRTSLHTSFQEYFQNEVTLHRNILCPKNGNHVSVSVFDRVWHAGLRSFNIEEGLAQAIQALFENSSSMVLLNSQLGEFLLLYKKTLCLLIFILFYESPSEVHTMLKNQYRLRLPISQQLPSVRMLHLISFLQSECYT